MLEGLIVTLLGMTYLTTRLTFIPELSLRGRNMRLNVLKARVNEYFDKSVSLLALID